ncbi:protein kinase domain-containing protein [Endozoicomonas sp. 2B-B]
MDRIPTNCLRQEISSLVATQQSDRRVRGACGDLPYAFSKSVERHEMIGKGLFSHVYAGSSSIGDKRLPERFAVKVYDGFFKDVRFFNTEVKALNLLKECPFIVDIFASYIDKYPHVLLELGDIDLDSLIREMIGHKTKFTEGHLNFIIDNLSRAAQFMLKNGIQNKDLFDDNVVYFFNQGVLKFIDFNSACFDIPAEKNEIMKNIGLIVLYCKLKESHECKESVTYKCKACYQVDDKLKDKVELDKIIDETMRGSGSLNTLIKSLIKFDPASPIDPSQVYSSLGLKEALPQLTRT